jgi:hypothetical protein
MLILLGYCHSAATPLDVHRAEAKASLEDDAWQHGGFTRAVLDAVTSVKLV